MPYTNLTWAHQLATSGFDTIVVGFLHYHNEHPDPMCRLFFDDVPVCNFTSGAVAEWFQTVRAANPAIRILLSIGGGGCQDTFCEIAAYWQDFEPLFTSFYHELGVDGFDLDLELLDIKPFYPVLQAFADLATSLGAFMTVAPALLDCQWVDFLALTALPGGNDTVVSWMNCQTYPAVNVTLPELCYVLYSSVAIAFPSLDASELVYVTHWNRAVNNTANLTAFIIQERGVIYTNGGSSLYSWNDIVESVRENDLRDWSGNMSYALATPLPPPTLPEPVPCGTAVAQARSAAGVSATVTPVPLASPMCPTFFATRGRHG